MQYFAVSASVRELGDLRPIPADVAAAHPQMQQILP